MTISKIYIAAFGGLKDFTLELQDGFNVIFGENEQGKTTVMAFLKMMFYGGKGGKTLSKSPRQKYLPWSGEPAGGRVFFRQNGHNYCLEREFKKSDSSDRVTLRDMDLGTEETVSGAIGEKIFGLSEAAFERSVFIGQAVFPENNEAAAAYGELNARLSNLTTTGDENISYQQVKDRLDGAAVKLTTKKKVGAYDKNLQRIEELKTAWRDADTAAKHRADMQSEINRVLQEIRAVEKERKEVKAITDRENDLRQTDKLKRFLEAKKELDRFNENLRLNDGSVMDTVFLGKVNFCLTKYDKEKQIADDRLAQITELENNIDYHEKAKTDLNPEAVNGMRRELEQLKAEKEQTELDLENANTAFEEAQNEAEQSDNMKMKFHPLLLIPGALFLIGGVVLWILKMVFPAIGVGAVGLIGIILSFILRPENKSLRLKLESQVVSAREKVTDLKSAAADLQEKINRLTGEIDRAESALHSDAAFLNQQKEILANRKTELAEITYRKEAAFAELRDLFSRYKAVESAEELTALLPDLQERINRQKELKMQLKYLSDDLGNISYEEAAEKLAANESDVSAADTDFEAAKQRLDELTEQSRELAQRYSAIESDLKNELKHAVFPDVIEREIAELETAAAKQKRFLDAVDLAQSVLENSFAQVRRGYGSALETRTQEIFGRLTDGHYRGVRVSRSMELDAESTDTFGTHSVDYFSSGTVDQAYLSLRLAVSEGMADTEKIPILLDDVLCQYDDRRTEQALRFLKEYSTDTQTVLFTCHRAICEQAKSNDIPVLPLR